MTHNTSKITVNYIFPNASRLLAQNLPPRDMVEKITDFIESHRVALASIHSRDVKLRLQTVLIEKYIELGEWQKADAELESMPKEGISHSLLKRNYYIQRPKSGATVMEDFSKAINFFDVAFEKDKEKVVSHLVWAIDVLFQFCLYTKSCDRATAAQARKYLAEAKKHTHWDAKQERIISSKDRFFSRRRK